MLSVTPAPGGDAFHARDSCVGKRYVYTIREGLGTPFNSRYSWALGALTAALTHAREWGFGRGVGGA